MRIDVRFRGFEPSHALRRYAVRRVKFALDRFGGVVDGVTVRLADVNGPKGGADKRCHVEVRGAVGPVSIEAEGSDAYVVIDDAIERAAQTTGRRRARARRPKRAAARVAA